ncbi:MAG: metal-sulfur cluster assembly factor [bacterium]
MPEQEEIRERLKECYDPEIPVNIVDLGLIYSIGVEDDFVDVTMTLTAVGCPVADQMKAQVEQKVFEFDDVNEVDCEIVFEPPWDPDMVTEEGEAALSSMGVL